MKKNRLKKRRYLHGLTKVSALADEDTFVKMLVFACNLLIKTSRSRCLWNDIQDCCSS